MNSGKIFGVHVCDNIGISGTTQVHTKRIQKGGEFGGNQIPEIWEARVGIAIMGYAAETTTSESNPFDNRFRDNYARGFGTTEQEAILALKLDIKETADSLWT